MFEKNKILIGLGNELKNNTIENLKKGNIGRLYLDYLNKKYQFEEWIKLSNINCYVSEKDNIILIKPILSIFEKSGILIKNILSYFNYSNIRNVCFVIPDIYMPIGKYKYKQYTKIHEKLGTDFYNILNSKLINNLNNSNYLRLCLGINDFKKTIDKSVLSIFEQSIEHNEYKIFLKTFELADEYFTKKILCSNYITTNKIMFKQKYPAMEPQKRFKKNTSTRRYILDIYKHIHK